MLRRSFGIVGQRDKPLGSLASDSDLGVLHRWLSEFPADVVSPCLGWLRGAPAQTWVVGPSAALNQFRMDPARCLGVVAQTIMRAARQTGPVRQVVWLLENHDNRGLDDFEAEAVLGSFLDIEVLHQLGRGEARSLLLVGGTLREDRVGLSFRIGSLTGRNRARTLLGLVLLLAAPMRVSTIFLGYEEASLLSATPGAVLGRVVRRLVTRDRAKLGLWVPSHRTEIALSDLRAECSAHAALLDVDRPVELVRFEDPDLLNPPHRLAQSLERAGLRYDSSVVNAPAGGGHRSSTIRTGPYCPAGAYQPMPFDLRVPAGLWTDRGWVEIISSRFEEWGGDDHWIGFNAWRLAHALDRLPPLLDFRRMESYFQAMPGSLPLTQRYHEYRVYNWPPPQSSPRCTLLDCGMVDRLGDLLTRVGLVRRMVARGGRSCRVIGQAELLSSALAEASKRSRGSQQSALRQQIEEHGYLVPVEADRPLRADVADFVEFVGTGLGRVLELGSGYGELAGRLASRSDRYVRVDLVPRMLNDAHGREARSGVVADLHALPFNGAMFDTVIANNVLEHAYDPLVSLTEIRRVLRGGGRLYALIPLDALNPQHNVRTHLWKADERGIRQAFTSAGLTLRRLETIDLYAMGVLGSFPTCRGLVAKVEAEPGPSA